MPRIALVPPRTQGAARRTRATAVLADPAPAVAGPSAYDRIAALSAVPLAQPPARPAQQEGGLTGALGTVTAWAGFAEAYLAAYWRETGLIATMTVLAGLLFWRLGERSRHSDQELVLALDALPLTEQLALIEPEIEPDGLPLPVPVVALSEEPAERLLGETRPQRHFATLREAVEAMKADRLLAELTRKGAVSA